MQSIRELHRLRGVIEDKGGNITEVVADLLANYLGEQLEDMTLNLETVYRENSTVATQNKLPRDIVVQLTSKKLKEEIIAKSYKEPLEIEGKTIRILKELLKKVMENRKEFRPLTEKLKKLKIRFRWEIPTGLSFFFKGKLKIISDKEEMWTMIKELEKEFKSMLEAEEEGEIKSG